MPKVIEDRERRVVIVGGEEIEGFVEDNHCPECHECRIYHDQYDAYFCAQCNAWLELNCNDPDCEFCRERPATPLAGTA